jgi:hypothetical protein
MIFYSKVRAALDPEVAAATSKLASRKSAASPHLNNFILFQLVRQSAQR